MVGHNFGWQNEGRHNGSIGHHPKSSVLQVSTTQNLLEKLEEGRMKRDTAQRVFMKEIHELMKTAAWPDMSEENRLSIEKDLESQKVMIAGKTMRVVEEIDANTEMRSDTEIRIGNRKITINNAEIRDDDAGIVVTGDEIRNNKKRLVVNSKEIRNEQEGITVKGNKIHCNKAVRLISGGRIRVKKGNRVTQTTINDDETSREYSSDDDQFNGSLITGNYNSAQTINGRNGNVQQICGSFGNFTVGDGGTTVIGPTYNSSFP